MGDSKKLGSAVLIQSGKLGNFLNMPIREVLAAKGIDLEPYDEHDYWYREVVFIVTGTIGDVDECSNCGRDFTFEDSDDWEYCPYCGVSIDTEFVHEEYKTEAQAKKSDYYEELGIDECIRFGVKKRPDNPDDSMGILLGSTARND